MRSTATILNRPKASDSIGRIAYSGTMATLYECPQCGVMRTSEKDILSHCRNVKDHTNYDYERLQNILDGEYERELAPAQPTR
jgi:predicted RNA-binding Zn-ribbon protein involved in translation (DUF1610 family)